MDNINTSTLLTDLPQEVLSHILGFLPYTSIQDARLVCRKLYSASLDYSIINRERVVFLNDYPAFQPELLLESRRTFLHLRLETCPFSYDAEVWSRLGPGLNSLCFAFCKMSEDDLFAVLNQCFNLKHLKIECCDVRISCKTVGVSCDHEYRACDEERKLCLESFSVYSSLDPRLFQRILQRSPDLTSLAIHRLKHSTQVCNGGSANCSATNPIGANTESVSRPWFTKLWPLQRPEAPARPQEPAPDFPAKPLTIPCVFAYIKARGHKLKAFEFTLDWNFLSSTTGGCFKKQLHAAMSEALNLRLESVGSGADLTKEFLLNQKDCRTLKLSLTSGDDIELICNELPSLEEFHFALLRLQSADCIGKLTTLKELVTLRIEIIRHPRLSPCIDSDIFSQLCGTTNTTLKVLKLFFRTKDFVFSPECFKSLVMTYPALTNLSLEGCNGITDWSVQFIFRDLLALKTLVLNRCRYLSDIGLNGTLQPDNVGQTYSIARLKRLRLLQICHCPRLSGKAFTEDLKFPELIQLCLGFNNVYYERVMPFVKNNPTIVSLLLGNGPKFTTYRVAVRSETLRHLRYIILSGEVEYSRVGSMLKKQSRRMSRRHHTAGSVYVVPS